MARIRRVEDQREMERVVDDFVTQGYKVDNNGTNSTMMKKKSWGSGAGHLVVAALTIWWTFGIGNVLYAVFKNLTAEKVHIRIEDSN